MDIATPFATLAGRTAVVTGGARSIGLGLAATFQRLDMSLVVIDRDAEELANAVPVLQHDGPTIGVPVSMSTDDCVRPIEDALAGLPPVAVWVNNAGRVSHQHAEDVDLDVFEEVIRDNAASALRGSQIAYRAMTGSGGAIVNISSFVIERALPQRLSYATSKAALENVTRYCAAEWGRHGIRVNAVSPGYIETRLTQWPDDDPRTEAKRRTVAALPLRRTGTIDDIAHAVVFLASPLADYVTGQVVYLDGGWHVT